MERPLVELDSAISEFADSHQFQLSKNHKDWPERSLKWDGPISCIVQIWRDDLDNELWSLWACCFEDRGLQRFWKRSFPAQRISEQELKRRILEFLEEARLLVVEWRANPETLEFAGDIQPLT